MFSHFTNSLARQTNMLLKKSDPIKDRLLYVTKDISGHYCYIWVLTSSDSSSSSRWFQLMSNLYSLKLELSY